MPVGPMAVATPAGVIVLSTLPAKKSTVYMKLAALFAARPFQLNEPAWLLIGVNAPVTTSIEPNHNPLPPTNTSDSYSVPFKKPRPSPSVFRGPMRGRGVDAAPVV